MKTEESSLRKIATYLNLLSHQYLLGSAGFSYFSLLMIDFRPVRVDSILSL